MEVELRFHFAPHASERDACARFTSLFTYMYQCATRATPTLTYTQCVGQRQRITMCGDKIVASTKDKFALTTHARIPVRDAHLRIGVAAEHPLSETHLTHDYSVTRMICRRTLYLPILPRWRVDCSIVTTFAANGHVSTTYEIEFEMVRAVRLDVTIPRKYLTLSDKHADVDPQWLSAADATLQVDVPVLRRFLDTALTVST